jgi:hypothetical protein
VAGVSPRTDAAGFTSADVEMFPSDYFRFVDEAGGPERLRSGLAERFLAAGGPPKELEPTWLAYMHGIFGICLREVTPETIVRNIEMPALSVA